MRISSQGTLCIYALLILPLPLIILVGYLLPTLGVLGWSLSLPQLGVQHYATIIDSATIHAVIWRTLRICLLTTTISVAIAYLIAYRWRFASGRVRQFIELFVLLPFWLSMLIRAFAWLVLLRNDGLINQSLLTSGLVDEPLALVRNEVGALIGMVHFMVPYAVLPLLSSMRQIDDGLLKAASSLGAGRWATLKDVFLPLTLPGVAAASATVFVFSLGCFVTPALLGGGKAAMLAENIYIQMFQLSNWGLGAALSIVLMLMVAVCAVVFGKLVGFGRFTGRAA
ncbi:ABC transporter permease [Pseudomonas azotoformans]|uniref:Polyamine ABC transporter permease n=1 Tax=Pseudomonas azotoformans TaxID=47878 RepID=A0A127I148_PSEAZ|nr:ABC transporter permease [Pseudomonas azotoformans]AMN80544.1 polyamine ABC transporter permease [Pseudomonas azotoformans]